MPHHERLQLAGYAFVQELPILSVGIMNVEQWRGFLETWSSAILGLLAEDDREARSALAREALGPRGVMKIEVIQASPSELGEALSILQEANEWTGRDGARMWRDAEIGAEKIRGLIESGSLYLARVNGEVVGTISYEVEDPVYYPEITDGSTAFVHLLAVRRAFGGQGVGKALITWAREKAIDEGKTFLRLDCVAERQRLCAFYESLGFTKTGVRWIEADGEDAALFEMDLTS